MIVAPAVEKPKSLQPNAEPPAAPFAVKVVPPAVISFERSDVNLPVEKGSNRMLTIIMRATDDKQRDIRRLKRIMAWCAQARNDRFCFLMFENNHRHLLDFPNDTIGISADLVRQLVELVGDENIQVEIIKLQ